MITNFLQKSYEQKKKIITVLRHPQRMLSLQ